jgi:hypothetical protein
MGGSGSREGPSSCGRDRVERSYGGGGYRYDSYYSSSFESRTVKNETLQQSQRNLDNKYIRHSLPNPASSRNQHNYLAADDLMRSTQRFERRVLNEIPTRPRETSYCREGLTMNGMPLRPRETPASSYC